jgi:hypothetical protein
MVQIDTYLDERFQDLSWGYFRLHLFLVQGSDIHQSSTSSSGQHQRVFDAN